MKPVPPFKPQTPLLSSSLNQMVSEINRLGNIQSSTLEVRHTPGGVTIEDASVDNRILVRLTSRNGAKYNWTQVEPTGDGGWFTPDGGNYGTKDNNPAYEMNASEINDFPFYTWLERGGIQVPQADSGLTTQDDYYDCWIFNAGGAGIGIYDTYVELDLVEDICLTDEIIDGGTF